MRLSLNGDDWTLRNTSSTSTIPAYVPGEVYIPLVNAGILSDPYYGDGVNKYQWVPQQDWIYSKIFNINQSVGLLNYRVVQLVMYGIDTKANISINGELIFTNDNMFHRNVINIKSLLKYGENNITIYLYSKYNWAKQEHDSCNAGTDGQCPGGTVNYIRTEPCSFGWDWGPSFAPVGIWKEVEIEAYNYAIVGDFMIYSSPVNDSNYVPTVEMLEDMDENMSDEWLIYNAFKNKEKGLKDYTTWNTQVIVYIDSGADNVLNPAIESRQHIKASTIKGSIEISIPSLINKTFTMDIEIPENVESNFTVNLNKLSGITQWMPNDWGQQMLYEFRVNFVAENNNSDSDTELGHNFGFREIELIQEPLPGGRSFYFRINGVNIPVHGSNWIPSFALDNGNRWVNTTSLEPLFIQLSSSHQNMIRNWGGGIYQQNDFYDLADKYGIMIWHDFMFACAEYWTNPEWLKSARKEVFDNVRHIQHHPSITIWAANNENGGYCKQGEQQTAYVDLYWKTVLDNVKILDPTRPRVSSSPSNGNETEQDPCSNCYDAYYGDVHQYLYNQDCWNTDIYVKARFVSEFGWQSWPSYPTMTQFLPQSEWSYNSAQMQNRQHHGGGQAQIVTEILNHYNLPQNWNNTQGYRYMLYASQYSQAYCYKVEVEFFRSLRTTCSNGVPGCTMGAMYWQTNDIWPGCSWSGVDYLSRYKMVGYYGQHFYAKVVVTGYDNGKNYTFWAINDYTNEWKCDASNPCVLEFQSNSFEKSTQMNLWNVTLTSVDYESASLVYSLSHSDFLTQSKCASLITDCGLKWRLIDLKTNAVINRNWMFISSPNGTKAMDPKLTITSVKDNGDNAFVVSFNCKSIASFVWMETNVTGNFDDNGMGILYPGDYQLQFNATQKVTANQLQNSLYLYSLYEAGGFAS